MSLSLKIALRYLFSPKSHSAINAVSIVSVCGVAVATMAMICTLSVYNGFEEIISSLYSEIDPHIEIRAATGKTLQTTAPEVEQLYKIEGVEAITPVIEDNALALFGDRQQPVIIKGVPSSYSSVSDIDKSLVDGVTAFADTIPKAVIGVGVSNTLMVAPYFVSPIKIYSPKRMSKVNMLNPLASFNYADVYCTGVFSISQPEYDDQVIYVPISIAKELFNYTTEATQLEIKVSEGYDVENVKKEVMLTLGDSYIVKNRMEQKSEAFSMMKIEKWITFLMLAFVLIIAAFNIIGSVSMLIIDKKNNIKTLSDIGASQKFITQIFFNEGVLISAIGAVVGLIIGLILSLLQQHVGLLRMGSNFIVEFYPVKVIFSDVIMVLLTVTLVSVVTAWYPIKYLNSKILSKTK